MTHIKDYAWAAFLALAIAFGAWLSHAYQRARIERAETALAVSVANAKGLQKQVNAHVAANAAREAGRKRVTQQAKDNHVKLDKALAAVPDWADQPVPADVAASLRAATRRPDVRTPGPGAVPGGRAGAGTPGATDQPPARAVAP